LVIKSKEAITLWRISNLSEDKLIAIKTLEEGLRKPLLTFSSLDLDHENLNEDELIQIKELEDELGVAIVVVRR